MKTTTNQESALLFNKYLKEALGIWEGGACNPVAIVNFIKRYVDDMKDIPGMGSTELATSAPMRLALAQLGHLAGIGIGECYDLYIYNGDTVNYAHTVLGIN